MYNGRLLFACIKCNICGVLRSSPTQDEAYLEFLDRYDSGELAKTQDIDSLVEQEKLLRPIPEINFLLARNNAEKNDLLMSILHSKKDYVVDFRGT